MIFDFQSASLDEGIMVFPDYPFAALPRPEPLIEQDFVQGTPDTMINIDGNI